MTNKRYFICIIAIMMALFGCMVGQRPIAFAASSDELGVIEELSKDPTFRQNDYPNVSDDYSLQVIQIGESDRDELYVYVYQPAHETFDLTGTKISISYGYSVNGSGLSPQLYDLKLVSTYSVFDKYRVKGFTVPNDGERFYNIVEIFRAFNNDIDGEQGDDYTIQSDRAYSVGQQWYVHDVNDTKVYEMNTFRTMLVTTVINSFVTLSSTGANFGGVFSGVSDMDCWYIAFNAEDSVIRHIYDADVGYSIRSVNDPTIGSTEYTPWQVDKTVRLKDTDTFTVTTSSGWGLNDRTFKWTRILTSSAFVKQAENDDYVFDRVVKNKLNSSQWVFVFLNTERTSSAFSRSYSQVKDVGVLRLHFQDTSGKIYDLGVVNSLTSSTGKESGHMDPDDFWDMFVKVIMIIVLIILILVLLKFAEPVMKVIKLLFKGIVFIITAPFKMIKALFDKPNKSYKR